MNYVQDFHCTQLSSSKYLTKQFFAVNNKNVACAIGCILGIILFL